MIYIAGVHGAGKTYFCEKVRESVGIDFYSASSLIRERRRHDFPNSKFAQDMENDRLCLLDAVDELKKSCDEFILDGHFCLLNKDGKVTRLPMDTFTRLSPSCIIMISEDPAIIAERLKERDNMKRSISEIRAFQEEERQYAAETAEALKIPLIISEGSHEIPDAVEYLRSKFNSVE